MALDRAARRQARDAAKERPGERYDGGDVRPPPLNELLDVRRGRRDADGAPGAGGPLTPPPVGSAAGTRGAGVRCGRVRRSPGAPGSP